ncbi:MULTISPECIES: outer membrane protein transport protein [unclassified Pasteurella]|uniref:outer membrane protein transport protein n=1 Tax=unclassified Pasteurella TaxID=2621516 RepID=UPI0010731A36|nr:transporter [Pasteurella sp. 19428wF3_WM03]TFU51249.1 transporter [Pasteurella sp. WM03]
MKKFNQSLLTTAMLFAAGGANAAAFQLAEVSTSGLGRAYAGEAAIADNASVVATNPALMTLFKRPEISFGGVYVDAKVNLKGEFASNSPQISGLLANKNADQNNVVPSAFVPNAYFVYPVNEKFSIGGGMNVPFGLKTEFDSDYTAGVFGGKTDLTAINLNLSGAYRISEGLSFGLGINALYTKAKLERTAGVGADLINARASAQAGRAVKVLDNSDVVTRLQDNEWGFGWNAGLVYEFNERNRLGVAYHSPITVGYKDHSAFNRTLNRTDTAKLDLDLPGYWEISGYHKVTDKFAFHYSYKYTHWKRFKELKANYTNDGVTALQKDEYFRGNSRIALGGSYDATDKLTLRSGIAYDETAADSYHSASIPDTDRTWYSLGATYKVTPDLSIDVAYAHLKGKKITFKEQQENIPFAVNYTSKSSANLYGLNVNYRF